LELLVQVCRLLVLEVVHVLPNFRVIPEGKFKVKFLVFAER
jgi:hypothetical protein